MRGLRALTLVLPANLPSLLDGLTTPKPFSMYFLRVAADRRNNHIRPDIVAAIDGAVRPDIRNVCARCRSVSLGRGYRPNAGGDREDYAEQRQEAAELHDLPSGFLRLHGTGIISPDAPPGYPLMATRQGQRWRTREDQWWRTREDPRQLGLHPG